ncbi:cytochrome P450 family protein [Nonomuraea aridisoli]|nr:cytochrome P450 [Nonomuraea aridisoli]
MHPLPSPGERLSQTVRRLREEAGPVVPVELPGGVAAWLVASYDAVNEILAHDSDLYSNDPRNFTALHDGTIAADWPLRYMVQADHLLMKDGAEHRRLRGLINRAFTPALVHALEPRIRTLAGELLDRMAAEGGRVDLVRHYTEPLPVTVICELFGVPAQDRGQVRDWIKTLVAFGTASPELAKTGAELGAYLSAHVRWRRREPGDDLTTALCLARDEDGDRLIDDELVWVLWAMMMSGHETTVHLITNAVVALCSDRAQLDAAIAGDGWAEVVEETLRSRGSVVNALCRYPLRDVRIGGVSVPAGQALVIGFGATGTDPARFGEDAERFDVSRAPEAHLGFGRGEHFCLGAPLARLEVGIALSMLFTRFPGLRLAVDAGDLDYTSSISTEGPTELPVLLR